MYVWAWDKTNIECDFMQMIHVLVSN